MARGDKIREEPLEPSEARLRQDADSIIERRMAAGAKTARVNMEGKVIFGTLLEGGFMTIEFNKEHVTEVLIESLKKGHIYQ